MRMASLSQCTEDIIIIPYIITPTALKTRVITSMWMPWHAPPTQTQLPDQEHSFMAAALNGSDAPSPPQRDIAPMLRAILGLLQCLGGRFVSSGIHITCQQRPRFPQQSISVIHFTCWSFLCCGSYASIRIKCFYRNLNYSSKSPESLMLNGYTPITWYTYTSHMISSTWVLLRAQTTYTNQITVASEGSALSPFEWDVTWMSSARFDLKYAVKAFRRIAGFLCHS